MTTLGEELVAWSSSLAYEDIPTKVIDTANARIVDTIGVIHGGFDSDAGEAVRSIARRWGGSPEATVVGSATRLPAEFAALVNGTYAHAMDYDDTHLPSIIHPSAALLPAVLATAEAVSASREETLTGLVVGYEAMCRLAMAQFKPSARGSIFFDRGLHATSILGTVAGSIACSRVMALDREGTLNALAIACSLGSGIIEANRAGGSVKKFHCGWAAHGAVTATYLATAGLTGPTSVLEGRFGLFQAFAGQDWNPNEITKDLGSHWYTVEIHTKPYPCNHFTHAIVDAVLRLKARGLGAPDVRAVNIRTATASWRTIGDPLDAKRVPSSTHHARFSAPFVFATALVGGGGLGVDANDFSESALADPKRLAIAQRCIVTPDPICDARFPYTFPAIVEVETSRGGRIVELVVENRGGPQHPLTPDELEIKLLANLGENADEVIQGCQRLDIAQMLTRPHTQKKTSDRSDTDYARSTPIPGRYRMTRE